MTAPLTEGEGMRFSQISAGFFLDRNNTEMLRKLRAARKKGWPSLETNNWTFYDYCALEEPSGLLSRAAS